jgi:hypothetical protein
MHFADTNDPSDMHRSAASGDQVSVSCIDAVASQMDNVTREANS